MTFSDGFSGSFSKQESAEPPNIGHFTTRYYTVFGTRDIGSFTEEFNIVMGDWKIGDYPP